MVLKQLKPKESEVVKACLDWLFYKKIFAYRNNTGAFKTTYKNKRGVSKSSFVRYGAVGSPDIIAIHKGLFIGIECKVPGKKQSEDQIKFEAKVKKAGGNYMVVCGVDDLDKEFDNLCL